MFFSEESEDEGVLVSNEDPSLTEGTKHETMEFMQTPLHEEIKLDENHCSYYDDDALRKPIYIKHNNNKQDEGLIYFDETYND